VKIQSEVEKRLESAPLSHGYYDKLPTTLTSAASIVTKVVTGMLVITSLVFFLSQLVDIDCQFV
jgi:hypothetical protein